jgi:hypothetical protein
MTSHDLQTTLYYLSRVMARGVQEEDELIELIEKIKKQIVCTNQGTNMYNEVVTKVA